METMDELDTKALIKSLIELEQQSASHREELLKKYSKILIRLNDMVEKSEARVDHINKMVSDLITITSESNKQNGRAQEIVSTLIGMAEAKERRLQRLEEHYDDLEKKYDALLDKYTTLATSKASSTNYNIQQKN